MSAAPELEQAELELEARERALEELGPLPARLSQALAQGVRHAGGARAGRGRGDRAARERIKQLAEAEAELAAREKGFTEKSDRLRVEQRRLADRERDLAQFHRDLLDPDALDTTWVAQRDHSFAEAESALEERRRELDTREQELDEHQVRENARIHVAREELERREHELAELRERLDRREQELNAYVAQLQSGLVRD